MAESGFDILIPFHGGYKMVRELIGSICLFTRHVPYRITLIDDGSPNKDYFYSLARTQHIDGARHEEQKGFGAAINTGIRLTKRPWIVILNSDCVIEEMSWLNDLYETMVALKEQKVRFVSARTDNPTSGDPELLKSPRLDRKVVGNIISKTPLPMFCTLISRKMVEQVGPVKEYPFGFFEDEEYFYRMKSHGFHQAVSGKAWVRHLGGKTVEELWQRQPETRDIMLVENRNRCLKDVKLFYRK
jgi:GT2 family glycosyltransferase